MKFSVITPAHNEENFIQKCADSVRAAARHANLDCEHIVVLNRCSDRTEEIAMQNGCRIVREDARNLSRIRNAGVAVARNEIIVTIDADCWMSPNMLPEVQDMLSTGDIIGGGVRICPERLSLGIACSLLVVLPVILWHRVSAGMFWCSRADFNEVGGFDESLICVEDLDFAKRLRAFGLQSGKRYGTIKRAHITMSCRKFDQFGDWCFVCRPKLVMDIFRRKQRAADEFYYNARSSPGERSKQNKASHSTTDRA